MLRRLIALVLAFSFGMYYAEALIADVHDGDATVTEQAHFAQSTGHHDVAMSAIESGSSDHSATPSHSVHTCHESHAHTCVVQAIEPMSAKFWPFSVEIGDGATRPIDLRQEPQLRPPIA
ncbi:MAG: hypothetical protein ACO1Q7_03090 [Gemmatimonas sp.]